jgi:hypothetical protein
MKKLLLAAIAALTLAPAAEAGCWATVKLSSMPTTRVWNVNLTPLQHGRTLLPDAKPRIEIRAGTNPWKVFRPRREVREGVFAFRVTFGKADVWKLRIWDGFEPHCASYHSYKPVDFSH